MVTAPHHPRRLLVSNTTLSSLRNLASHQGKNITLPHAEFDEQSALRGGLHPLADLVTASASGLDPEISPASAEAQAARVAKARGISLEQVEQIISKNTKGPELGFLGEPRVNVLELNLELDRRFPHR
jgi:K+-transporting ATPase KdpC subunit